MAKKPLFLREKASMSDPPTQLARPVPYTAFENWTMFPILAHLCSQAHPPPQSLLGLELGGPASELEK